MSFNRDLIGNSIRFNCTIMWLQFSSLGGDSLFSNEKWGDVEIMIKWKHSRLWKRGLSFRQAKTIQYAMHEKQKDYHSLRKVELTSHAKRKDREGWKWTNVFHWVWFRADVKGTLQKLLSGFFPLRGYPPPHPPNGKSVWKKKVFFLNGIGGFPPPP